MQNQRCDNAHHLKTLLMVLLYTSQIQCRVVCFAHTNILAHAGIMQFLDYASAGIAEPLPIMTQSILTSHISGTDQPGMKALSMHQPQSLKCELMLTIMGHRCTSRA